MTLDHHRTNDIENDVYRIAYIAANLYDLIIDLKANSGYNFPDTLETKVYSSLNDIISVHQYIVNELKTNNILSDTDGYEYDEYIDSCCK